MERWWEGWNQNGVRLLGIIGLEVFRSLPIFVNPTENAKSNRTNGKRDENNGVLSHWIRVWTAVIILKVGIGGVHRGVQASLPSTFACSLVQL